MKLVLAGGTGQVGTILARAFHAAGHDVVILSRQPAIAPWRVVQWDARTPGPWTEELDGADAVINLAGRSVDCRYTPANREAILSSRVQSTRAVGAAIAHSARPPHAWLQMSTATIYAHRYDAPNDEATGIIGGAELDAPDTWRFSISRIAPDEHHVACFDGDLRSRADRDADVSTHERRCVVNAVPDHADAFAFVIL